MFAKLPCHSCGARSNHPKGTYYFDCTTCDAPNYYDIKGVVLDPPTPVAAAPSTSQRTYASFAREPSQQAPQQDTTVFCSRCRKNQQIYTEALSNYLPDESHPRYAEFEAGLPAAKAKLEKEYPLVCTGCADKAQLKIHKADYYGKSQQIGRMAMQTRKTPGGNPVGSRDDWGKFGLRRLLDVVGTVVYASLLAQVVWHAYGICVALTTTPSLSEMESDDFDFDPTFQACTRQITALRFDTSCFRLYAALIPTALLASLCLLWYNPGLKQWYHHSRRIEAVDGQTQHFRIQGLLLVARAYAWFTLSDDAAISKHKLLASHSFMIVFSIACQWLSHRVISVQRWTLKGKIMPRPSEVNVFSATAGPADESYDRQASSVPPHLRLSTRNNKPFPIANLAPRRGYSKLDLPSMPPPSPPDTQSSPSDDEDAMDIDSAAYNQPRNSTSSFFGGVGATQSQPSGWSAMRTSLFDIDDRTRVKQEQDAERVRRDYNAPTAVKEQSPFHGHLPPAPMSMGKRLRNPPQHVIEEKIPLSQRPNFMELMRPGNAGAGVFGRPAPTPAKPAVPSYADPFAYDDDFSPVKQRASARQANGFVPKSRVHDPLELRPAQFTLQRDVNNETGLENMFGGGSFSIADLDAVATADVSSAAPGSGLVWVKMAVGVALIGIAAAIYLVPELKTAMYFWFLGLWAGIQY